MRVRLQLLAAILARWQCPVTSTKALDLLYWATCAVSYRRTAGAIKMASKVGPFFWHRAMPSVLLQRARMAIEMARMEVHLFFATPFFACHNCS
jgi:hypothetical protein